MQWRRVRPSMVHAVGEPKLTDYVCFVSSTILEMYLNLNFVFKSTCNLITKCTTIHLIYQYLEAKLSDRWFCIRNALKTIEHNAISTLSLSAPNWSAVGLNN